MNFNTTSQWFKYESLKFASLQVSFSVFRTLKLPGFESNKKLFKPKSQNVINVIQNQDAKNCCSYALRFEFIAVHFGDWNQYANSNISKYKPKSKKKILAKSKCEFFLFKK